MRVTVTGATGNVGTALLRRLSDDPRIGTITGISRRTPSWHVNGVEWRAADVTTDDLSGLFQDADAVVHLAWQIQPGRDQRRLWEINVLGSQRVFEAVRRTEVGTLVYASSVGAYSPTGGDARVTEEHPTHGIASSTYSRQKAYVERMLDAFEQEHDRIRVVRMRPALIFQRDAASEVRRFFLGSLFPNRFATSAPLMPRVPGLRFQAVHADDVAEAYRLALTQDVRGPFNIAAEPVLTLESIADRIGVGTVPVPGKVLRSLAALSWRARLHPVEPGWIDLALDSPVMDTRRAERELGWSPSRRSVDAVVELLEAIAEGAGARTPTLRPDRERTRLVEAPTGQGARYSTDDATEPDDTRPRDQRDADVVSR